MAVVRILAHDGSSRALQTFPLTGANLVVGRAPEADICIDEPSLSRHHARILWANGAWVVVEIASTNGVMVAGQRVASHTLRDGERFRLGQIELEFREVDPREAQTLAVDGQAAAQLMQEVRAQRAAMAPTPPTPAQAKSGGPGPAIAVALALVVVGAGGAGAWWFLVGRQPEGDAAKPPDPAPADKAKSPADKADAPPPGDAVTTIVAKDETVKVQVEGGPTVTLLAGTFAAGTAVTIRRVDDAIAATVAGLRRISPVWDFDAGGLQPSKDVTLSFVLTEKPTLGPDDRLVAVRSEGGKLHAYATDYDPSTGRVRTRIDHFTPIHLVVGGVTIIGTVLGAVTIKDDEIKWTYDTSYTTPEGFRIYYETSGKHAPAVETQSVGGHPRYVVRIGEELDASLRTFTTNAAFSSFTKPGRDDLPNVFVKNTGAVGNVGTFAFTSGSAYSMVFHNALGARRIAATAPHELFHALQVTAIGSQDNAKEKLWSEMSAEWAAFVVNPADAGPEISATVTAAGGFVDLGMHGKMDSNDQYAAGELAIFLESKCAGLMKGLYSSSGSLNPWASHDPWYTSTQTQMRKTCPSVVLADTLDEYYARFFHVGGLPTGRAPVCKYRKGLQDAVPFKSGTNNRAAASAECDQVQAASELEPGMLVLEAQGDGPGLELWVTELTRPGGGREVTTGGNGVLGFEVLATARQSFVLDDFGGSNKGGTFDGAKLLLTNPTDLAGGSISYNAWILQRPKGVAATYEKGPRRSQDEVAVKWDASKLPLASGTSGALKSYKILQKTGSGTRELAVVDAPATATKIAASAITWTKRQAELVVRVVDRLRNESKDSLVVVVTQPAEEPKPKPKPKPKPEEPKRPDLPEGPCIINPQHPSCRE